MRRRSRWLSWMCGMALLLFWLVDSADHVAAAPFYQEDEPVPYVVQAGDSLFRIAQRHGTTVAAIAEANGIVDPSRIAVGQRLIIPSVTGEASSTEGRVPSDESKRLTNYLIVPGDTLDAVARRFESTTTMAVAALNGIANPVSLPAGRQLSLPGNYVGRLRRVADGETALGLALRYDVPLWQFLAANDLSSPGALVPGQRIWNPRDAITDTLPLPFRALDVGPVPVLQGHTVSVKADLESESDIVGVFHEEVLKFALEGDTHFALFGVHALAQPGRYTLALLATDADGAEVYLTRSVEVVDAGYSYYELVLPADRDETLNPERSAIERARIEEIEVIFTPERYWDGLYVRPMDTELTSEFGETRLYKSPSYQFTSYHAGTDFNGEVGDPVHAPAPGVVVLAEELFVRGNAVIIDHGWGIYTGYWHLSQIDVTVGQSVKTGDQIALVGNTGLSTGSHLHWDFWVNGTNVSALQWTEHPFP